MTFVANKKTIDILKKVRYNGNMKRVDKQVGYLKKRGVVFGFFFALVFCTGIAFLGNSDEVLATNYYVNAGSSNKFNASYARNFVDLMDAESSSRSGSKCGSDNSHCVKDTSNLLNTIYGSTPGGATGQQAGYYAKNTSYDCNKYYVTFYKGAFSWEDGWLDVRICPRTSNSSYAWAIGTDGRLYDFRQHGNNRATYFRFHFYKAGTSTQVGFKGIFYTTDNDHHEGHKITSGSQGIWLYNSNTTLSKDSSDWWLGNRDCGYGSGDANPLYCMAWFEVKGTTSSPFAIGYKSQSVSRTSGIGVEDNEYKGKSRVGSSTSYSQNTGWTNECSSEDITNGDCTVTYTTNCATSGCTAKIQHSLKQSTGYIGTSEFKIVREFNITLDKYRSLGQTPGVVTNGGTLASGMLNYYTYRVGSGSWTTTSSGSANVKTSSIKLYPGMQVCETLKFREKTSSSGYKRTKACAEAKVTNFAGKSIVSGAANGENTAANRKMVYISASNCPSNTGCKVKFEHQMKRSGSTGTSAWKVSRISNANLMSADRRIASNSNVGSGNFGEGSDEWKRVNGPNGDFTLYPGMVVCERLTYKPSNDVTTTVNDTYTEICAAVKRDAPSDSVASIGIVVKNNSVTRYNQYQREVYAKPGDSLTYKATYSPLPQADYKLIPERMRIDGGTIYPNDSINTDSILQDFFNANKGNLGNWNNAFSVHYSINTGSFGTGNLVSNYQYNVGDAGTKEPTNSRTVAHSDAGRSVDERAKTNVNDTTKTTPKSLIYSEGNVGGTPILITNVETTSIESFACTRVPYNFNTTIKIQGDDKEETIDAGEDGSVKYNLALTPKTNYVTTNPVTNSNGVTTYVPYTTRAESVNRKLVVYNPATIGKKAGGTMAGGRNADVCSGYFGLSNNEVSCGYSEAVENDIDISNNNEMKNGKTLTGETRKFYAQDLPAGSKICVAVAVFPASSGADTNWNNKNYSSSWRISDSKCYVIAKKPSLQVWGGNIYTNGKISTLTADKYNVSGYTNYKVGTANGKKYIFGSWGELGLIAGSTIKGFASAAATGYGANDNGVLWPAQTYLGADGTSVGYTGRGNNADSNHFPSVSPGGIYGSNTSFCLRSKLTISNKNCSSGAAGEPGLASAVVHTDKDKNAVEAKFIQPGLEQEKANAGDAGERSINLSSSEVYYYGTGKLSIAGATVVTRGTPKIVHAKNIAIEGNIQYGTVSVEVAHYTSLGDIPKLVIYADEDINIGCNVSRIDALLIAGHSVTTCNNYTNAGNENGIKSSIVSHINDEQNSNQLIINGAVITNILRPNRTYGAATGANSIIPAEIINFDPSLYLWGDNDGSNESSAGSVEINYIRELSPRK